jgi:NodT family efflux transporter outer membrane factor (OMF) lipoprotein
MIRRPFLAVGLCALAAGCTVGPDFHAPAPPLQTRYDREALTISDGRQSWEQGSLDAQWWHDFASPGLDRLIARALAHNTDLAAAQAALRQAHELWRAQHGVMLPTVDAGVSSTRNKSSQYLSPVLNDPTYTYGLQTAQVSVGYTLDIFGGNRRSVEQAHAQYDAQAFQTEAARISLINNVIAAAVQQASLAGQVEAQREMIAAQQEMLEILRHQADVGQAAGADVIAQQAQLAAAQAALPPLQRALAQSRDLIAYLTGQTAADEAEPDLRLADLTLPRNLPLSLPSDLVRQRPDIRAAQANLHAAGAGVGIAIANRLPQITLAAGAGAMARAGRVSCRRRTASGRRGRGSRSRSSMAARCCTGNAPRGPPMIRPTRNIAPPCWPRSRMSPIRWPPCAAMPMRWSPPMPPMPPPARVWTWRSISRRRVTYRPWRCCRPVWPPCRPGRRWFRHGRRA